MSVYKRKTKTGLTTNYYYDFSINGKTYRGTCKTPNKRIALDIEATTRLEIIKQDELGVKKKISFYEALDIVRVDVESRPYKSTTPNIIKKIKEMLHDRPLHKLKNGDLFDLLDKLRAKRWTVKNSKNETVEKGLKIKTIENYFAIIRQTQKAAQTREYLINYDLEMPIKKSRANRVRVMNDVQRWKLLESLHPSRSGQGLASNPDKSTLKYRQRVDNFDFTIMLLDTGCRYTEIAQLKWSDVDISKQKIMVWRGKTKIETHLIMTDQVYSMLMKRMQNPNKHATWIFTDVTGETHRKYSSIAIRNAIKRIDGLEYFSLHDLRHCCASKLVNAGMTIPEVAIILGHRDISTTMQYAHLDVTNVTQKAADILNKGGNAAIVMDLVESN